MRLTGPRTQTWCSQQQSSSSSAVVSVSDAVWPVPGRTPPPVSPFQLCSADLDGAETAHVEPIAERRFGKAGRDDAAGHHDVALPHSLALRCQMVGEPRERLEGMAEGVRAPAPPDFDTILIDHAYDSIEHGRWLDESAEDDPCVPRVVRDQRSAVEHRIIRVAIIHQFDRGADRIDR